MTAPVRPIAIDGPAGAGKSTLAPAVADAARARSPRHRGDVPCGRLGGAPSGDRRWATHRPSLASGRRRIASRSVERGARQRSDVTHAIRSAPVDTRSVDRGGKPRGAPRTGAPPAGVGRRAGGGVVEGRDIGTVVFPDAELKVYLTACRTSGRSAGPRSAGVSLAEVAAALDRRDRLDSTRPVSPLPARIRRRPTPSWSTPPASASRKCSRRCSVWL